MSRLLLATGLLALALAGLSPAPGSAELVVLTDSSVLKVTSFAVEGDVAVLTFAIGGAMRMSMLPGRAGGGRRGPAEPEKGAAALGERSGYDFLVRFDEGQSAPTSAYGELIFAAARRHRLNPELVAAVIRAESAFNPRALSRKGARGLMQLMPATARRYGVTPSELWKPERNIEAGVRYLAFLADKFEDDLPRILAGYNAGEGSVMRYGGIPPYRETQGYVRRIFGYLGLDAGAALASARPFDAT
ncbi:MAG: lytic transglycosylase domain-containing protein [Thermoanaerobaculia bacterium]